MQEEMVSDFKGVCKTTTHSSVISFDPTEGFLRVTSNPVDEITMADAQRDFDVAAEMVNYTRTPVMADSRHYTGFSDEIRNFYASKEVGEKINAMAIIISSLPTRIIGNFFIRMHKPLYPTRLFTSEKEAGKWLGKFVRE